MTPPDQSDCGERILGQEPLAPVARGSPGEPNQQQRRRDEDREDHLHQEPQSQQRPQQEVHHRPLKILRAIQAIDEPQHQSGQRIVGHVGARKPNYDRESLIDHQSNKANGRRIPPRGEPVQADAAYHQEQPVDAKRRIDMPAKQGVERQRHQRDQRGLGAAERAAILIEEFEQSAIGECVEHPQSGL